MLYPKCMTMVTVSKWLQFSSYQAALEHPAVAVLGSAEFAEKTRNLVPTVAAPTKDCLSLGTEMGKTGLDKTLLSILSEDESTRTASDRQKMRP